MTTSQQLVDSYVNRAVEEFGRNPLCTKLLRRLADELPDEFSLAAMRQLEESGESEACRLLTILLVQQPDLMEQLADPARGSRGRAIATVRQLLILDPTFDIRLAHMLPDRNGQNHQEALTGANAVRVLDILDEVSSGRRLLPLLSHLVSSDDRKISSRAALFIGRRVQRAEWAVKQMTNPDERVRANAIESIWGLRSDAAISLLEGALDDPNNRVAGNALLGLHIAEAPGVAEIAMDMAHDAKARFRSTAAWVMGRIAGQEFSPELTRLLKDENSMVRSTALRALIEVRRYEAQELETNRAQAIRLSEEEAAKRARAAAEILNAIPELTIEPEKIPVLIELKLDGQSYSFRRA